MTVIAAKCEACSGLRIVKVDAGRGWTEWVDCPVCEATGYEHPPKSNPDKTAQQIIEGRRSDHE